MATQIDYLELPKFQDDNINKEMLKTSRKNLESLKPEKQQELMAALGWLFLTDDIKLKYIDKKKREMKINDLIALIFAFVGLITNITASYMYASSYLLPSKDENNQDTMSIIVFTNPTPVVQLLRLITTLTTGILQFFIYRHYQLRMEFMVIKQKVEVTSTLYSSGILWYMIIEMFICIFHSPPFLDNVKITSFNIDIDFYLVSLITFRVYKFLRFFALYSIWAEEKAEKICNECHTFGGISFAIKAELKENPYVIVGMLYGISVCVFGFALRNVEMCQMQDKPLAKFLDWRYISNGIWCIIITTFTVGFGDFYPQTHVGRIIAVTACLWGTFLTSLMVVALTISVAFTPQEEKAYEELKKQELDQLLKQNSVNLIRNAIKLKNLNDEKNEEKKLIRLDSFSESVKSFRETRNFSKSKELQVSEENILHKLNEKISYEMDTILIEYISYVDEIMEYLKLGKEIQKDINFYTDKLELMVKEMYDSIENDDKQANEAL